MNNEPELYLVPARGKKTHVLGDSDELSLCRLSVGDATKPNLQRLDIDSLEGNKHLCKRCKATSTKLYLDWVNNLTEDDLALDSLRRESASSRN